MKKMASADKPRQVGKMMILRAVIVDDEQPALDLL